MSDKAAKATAGPADGASRPSPRERVPGHAPAAGDYATAPGLAAIVDFFAPLHTPPGARPVETVIYGSAGRGGRPLHLFLHRREDAAERRPGVVFIHGGGWVACGPAHHVRHAHQLAAAGYVTANITYRLTSEAPWPAAMEDVKCAIRWMRANADELGLDPDRLAVAGSSAGGHLAAMAALTPGLWEGDGGNDAVSSAAQAAALMYPVVDLGPFAANELTRVMTELLLPGREGELAEASPITHVTSSAPPMLTLTGSADVATVEADIVRFHDLLDGAGVANELVVFEDRDHGFDFHPVDWLACFDRITTFLDQHL